MLWESGVRCHRLLKRGKERSEKRELLLCPLIVDTEMWYDDTLMSRCSRNAVSSSHQHSACLCLDPSQFAIEVSGLLSY